MCIRDRIHTEQDKIFSADKFLEKGILSVMISVMILIIIYKMGVDLGTVYVYYVHAHTQAHARLHVL